MSFILQIESLPNHKRPYPMNINEKGRVLDCCWGSKYRSIVGFSSKPVADNLNLYFVEAMKAPEKVKGMYPIMCRRSNDNWETLCDKVEYFKETEHSKSERKN